MTRLTAEQLDITQAEYDALLWVRDALDPTIADHDLPAWMQFEMNHWGALSSDTQLTSCGTPCCIGGSMEMHMVGLTSKLDVGDFPSSEEATKWQHAFTKVSGYPAGSLSLSQLFYYFPDEPKDRTREKAVEAIDRFFAGNTENPWRV